MKKTRALSPYRSSLVHHAERARHFLVEVGDDRKRDLHLEMAFSMLRTHAMCE